MVETFLTNSIKSRNSLQMSFGFASLIVNLSLYIIQSVILSLQKYRNMSLQNHVDHEKS